jgi:hypothetical protein
VVGTLARSDPDRRNLLRPYFETNARTGEQAVPTHAHLALARLAARGSVRVLITTNFDRLLERALEEEGVAPQVLTSPAAVAGMTPLAHAGVTVIKLHGDYAGGRLLNTPEELSRYPPTWRRLLERIFSEYGLLVVGWSAEYDVALVEQLGQSVGRRYAWYWATYLGGMHTDARRLVAGHGAHLIETQGADELFVDLEQRVAALDRIAVRRRAPRRTVPVHPARDRPSGWSAMPLVALRTAVAIGPALAETTGQLGPEVRDRLVAALNQAPVSDALRILAQRLQPVESGPYRIGERMGEPVLLAGWQPAPSEQQAQSGHLLPVFQTTTNAVYRLGTNAGAGVSGLLTVRGPEPTNGAQVLLTLDIGLSVADGVELVVAAELLRDSLISLTGDIATALDLILPPDAEATTIELHWQAPGSFDSTNRPVPASLGIDFTTLGAASREQLPYGSYAEAAAEPITPAAAAALVLRAFETVTVDSGYLDPRKGIAELRERLVG